MEFGFISLYMVVYEDGSVRVFELRGKNDDVRIRLEGVWSM